MGTLQATPRGSVRCKRMTSKAVLKINIGSGLSGAEGWYNIDNSPTVLLSRLPLGRKLFGTPPWPRDVRRHDVTKGLPFPDGSVTYIYSSHTFEHFAYEDSLRIAKECFRVLHSTGVVRIAVPDLHLIVNDYLHDESPLASHTFVRRLSLSRNFHDLVHPGSNHSQMFDQRSLSHMLKEAGFAAPEVCGFRSSRILDIALVELEERKHETLYVEAEK